MAKTYFVNLPVKDLGKTIAFFSHLGFKFNPKFSDENATCMIVSDDFSVMLLVEKFFKSFTPKEICDTHKYSEVLMTLSTESRKEVDEFIIKAIEAGGTIYGETQDYGWMYMRYFQDLDGHLWEVGYMDENAMPPA